MADWDPNNPGDSDFISQYPPNERAARSAVRTNFGVDHHGTDDADVGKHEHATMLDKGGDPTAASGQGVFYAKTVNGEIEAFYMDASGNAIQLTVNGKINALRFGETNTLGQTQLIEAAGGLNYWGVKSTDDSAISAFAVLDSAGNSILRIIGTGMDGAGAGRVRFNDADYYEFVNGGIVIGAPTDGHKGAGTLNLHAVYEHGVKVHPEETDTVELGGDFDAGEQVKCSKIGSQVVITAGSDLNHSSSSVPSSTSGVIPSKYRPTSTIRNVYHAESSAGAGLIAEVIVSSDGTFSVGYVDFGGNASSRVITLGPPSVSYTVV